MIIISDTGIFPKPRSTNPQKLDLPPHTHVRGRTKKVRELIAVRVLHTSLLKITVFAFEVLPLGSYTPIPASSPPFRTSLEMVLWNGLQRCRCHQCHQNVFLSIFPLSSGTEKVTGARSGE
jgi:hypothetical protein